MRLFSAFKTLLLLLLFAFPTQVLKAQCTATVTAGGPTSFCAGGSTLLTANATAVNGSGVTTTAGGGTHSLYLKSDGTMWTTGEYNFSLAFPPRICVIVAATYLTNHSCVEMYKCFSVFY